ncbi:hypothetical protein [Vibrio cholerae]|uniref:hypothetical protein n=1 Tax=Vibrio phage ICP2_2013_A_Haiti TaxID=1529058 RepID=UPI0004E5C0A2|nr:hypothetical protein [Vibrio cholerae]YP_009056234.1 hypothetical protein LD36_gp22 [Vibrio phage ICP2_2013_A_Haiti]AII27136.1 hypothetical protein ICP22013AHaiti_22 [Vibrio phage ICP2_2013_A_Haiti]
MNKVKLTPEELASGKWIWDEASSTFVNKDELLGNPSDIEILPINSENLKRRQAAYRVVSDPLFMGWQYDKTRQSEMAWRAAVRAIKLKFPLH